MPLTLQSTVVSVELETVAVNGSVSPSNTVPEFGEMETDICGGGGGFEVPPPLPEAHPARTTPKATRKKFFATWPPANIAFAK
jgi:hypothetical protein